MLYARETINQGSSTFHVRGPIYIFHIFLRATVFADYKIIMDILNIIIGEWASRQVPMTQVKQQKGGRMSCDGGGASFSNPHIASPMSQLILQSFCCFAYITAHATTLPLLHLHHRHFTYVTTHSTALLLLHLCHSHFMYITATFLHFTYVTTHSPTLPSLAYSPTTPSLHLRHNSFSNPSVALPTSQLIRQPFCCFTYVIGTSCTSPGEPPMHRGMWWTSLLLSLEVAIVLDSC